MAVELVFKLQFANIITEIYMLGVLLQADGKATNENLK